MHSRRCAGRRQFEAELHGRLQQKRKHHKLKTSITTINELRPSQVQKNFASQDISTPHSSRQPEDQHLCDSTVSLYCDDPIQQSHTHSTPISDLHAHPFDFPTYRPTQGSYRDQHDILPEAPTEPIVVSGIRPAHPVVGTSSARRILVPHSRQVSKPYITQTDSFGQFRVYSKKPCSIPDALCELQDVSDIQEVPDLPPDRSVSNIIYPCPNVSAFRLQYWHWKQGDRKSKGARESLVRDVLLAPDFSPADVQNIDWKSMDKALAANLWDTSSGWKKESINIRIPPRTPASAAEFKSNPSLGTLSIPNFDHQSLVSITIDEFTKNDQQFFHYDAYEAFCTDPHTSERHRVYGEVYESARMLQEQEAVRNIELDVDPPCTLPRCVAMIMVFSDAMQLANFGHASAWPIRVSFGNLSKYERCKPDPKNHYEVGFIPALPSDLEEKLRNLGNGRPAPKSLLTQLRRELIHAVWSLLLDDEFIRAWRHGIVIKCADGITRRVFPRIFSYSADYMEKILLATIRGMKSLRPCPRCLMSKSDFPNLGLPEDLSQRHTHKRLDNQARNDLVTKARSIIFDEGRAVTSERVESLLKSESYVPVQNAFSRLRHLGFDIFEALTVDLLHEFELGVWKSVFQHILRVLHTSSPGCLLEFNERFRLVPTFGNGVIRPFSEDVSNMTRPAARNYEDVLQCILPVIEGLLPPSCEQRILTLLFVLAQWHALAKLRRHTAQTVECLKHTTTRLGHELRAFRHYTSEIKVYETPREANARERRKRTRARPRAALERTEDCFAEADAAAPTPGPEKQQKYFNLETSKYHALGDYPNTISIFGTMDSISTQTGESLHRKTKKRYGRTNGRNYLPQIGEIARIEDRLDSIHDELQSNDSASTKAHTHVPTNPCCDDEQMPANDYGHSPYQMAISQKHPVHLSLWVEQNPSDHAVQTFSRRLKSHLLARLSSQRYQEEREYSSEQLSQIQLQFDCVYSHKTLKVHYTTYDVRRAQDIINPDTPKRFILVPSDEIGGHTPGAHQFWYAKVLGIYHANVSYNGLRFKRMDFLWVRWLGRAIDAPGGWDTCQLDRASYFRDSDDAHAFDFVDPSDVIRGAHLIPRFAGSRTNRYLDLKGAPVAQDGPLGDWREYYINRFVDRDMVMRFIGMAIGHMTHGTKSEYTAGVSAAELDAGGYEYSENTDLDEASLNTNADTSGNSNGNRDGKDNEDNESENGEDEEEEEYSDEEGYSDDDEEEEEGGEVEDGDVRTDGHCATTLQERQIGEAS